MALLAPDPKTRRTQLLLVGLVLGLGWYAGYTYYFKGRQESLRIKENQLEALEQKNRRSRSLAARRDDLNQRMEMYERQLLIFEEFIPQSEEVPELLDAISREAALTGVELARIRPRAATAGEGFYARQTWELSVMGDYHDIGRYLARIASLPRIIKPTNISLVPAARSRATRFMEAPLEVSLVIETFVVGALPDTAAAAG